MALAGQAPTECRPSARSPLASSSVALFPLPSLWGGVRALDLVAPRDGGIGVLTDDFANRNILEPRRGYCPAMKTRRVTCITVSGVLALIALVVAPGSMAVGMESLQPRLTDSAAKSDVPTAVLPDPTPKEQRRANEVSEAILDAVSGLRGYGGMWIDSSGLTHVAAQSAWVEAIRSTIGQQFEGEFTVDVVDYSYADLVARRDAISLALPELEAQGPDVVDWGPDEARNSIWVSLRSVSDENVRLVRAALGKDVSIEQALTTGGKEDLFSRSNDTSPYSGGIYTAPLSSVYPTCSSGFPIVINGTRYLTTAGHCYDAAAGGSGFPSNVYNGGAYMGRANWLDTSNYGVDTSIITAQGDFSLYRTSTSIVGYSSTPWTSVAGQTICSGGAFSGERCALPVIRVNYCSDYYYDDGSRFTCGVATAGKDGAQAAGHGDSGGPMYILSPSARVAGMVSAAASPQYLCSVQGPGQSVRTCSDYVRFQTVGSILDHWGTTM